MCAFGFSPEFPNEFLPNGAIRALVVEHGPESKLLLGFCGWTKSCTTVGSTQQWAQIWGTHKTYFQILLRVQSKTSTWVCLFLRLGTIFGVASYREANQKIGKSMFLLGRGPIPPFCQGHRRLQGGAQDTWLVVWGQFGLRNGQVG